MLDLILQGWDLIVHLDHHLAQAIAAFGPWTYVILALIIFCETGLVVTPFLPGDSLLFAAGALVTLPQSPMHIGVLLVLLTLAGIIGDAVNYAVGRRLGPRIFYSDTSWLLNKQHLLKTQAFYEKYGGKTIILARFVPIIRTFAPFVAGVGLMSYRRFAMFNVVGAILWTHSFLLAGYYFGNIPAIQQNFHFVILAILVLSVLPIAIEFIRAKRGTVNALSSFF